MRVFLLYITYIMAGTYLSISISPFFAFLSLVILILFILDLVIREDRVGYSVSNLYFFFTLKRVKTEYGKFYIKYRSNDSYYGDSVTLYQDKFFYMKEISKRSYSNINALKEWVKDEYSSIYNAVIRVDEKCKEIHSWNGYIDLESERADKLDKLVK